MDSVIEDEYAEQELQLLLRQRRWYLRMLIFMPVMLCLPVIMGAVAYVNAYEVLGSLNHSVYLMLHVAQWPLMGLQFGAIWMVTYELPGRRGSVNSYMFMTRLLSGAWCLGWLMILLQWMMEEMIVYWTDYDVDPDSASWKVIVILSWVGWTLVISLAVPMLIAALTFSAEYAEDVGVEHPYITAMILVLLILGALGVFVTMILGLIRGDLLWGLWISLLLVLAMIAGGAVLIFAVGTIKNWWGTLTCWKGSLQRIESWGMRQIEEESLLQAEGDGHGSMG